MRFATLEEHEQFGYTVTGVLGDWEPLREPAFGTWWDEHDEGLATQLAAAGWAELWLDAELLGPAVAGAIALGRACAPLSLLDEATLGAPLGVGDRVRHGRRGGMAALALPGWGLAIADVTSERPEPTIDGTGTVVATVVGEPMPERDAHARWRCWCASTLGYLAGLADGVLTRAVDHASSREQFGGSLGRLPAVQARLADAATLAHGIHLCAWEAQHADPASTADTLRFAGAACREVTAHALQVHGAIGFSLEGSVHTYLRRAKSVQVWTDAVLEATG